jgi:hypothetical protein
MGVHHPPRVDLFVVSLSELTSLFSLFSAPHDSAGAYQSLALVIVYMYLVTLSVS